MERLRGVLEPFQFRCECVRSAAGYQEIPVSEAAAGPKALGHNTENICSVLFGQVFKEVGEICFAVMPLIMIINAGI